MNFLLLSLLGFSSFAANANAETQCPFGSRYNSDTEECVEICSEDGEIIVSELDHRCRQDLRSDLQTAVANLHTNNCDGQTISTQSGCVPCQEGLTPNIDHTACKVCAPGTISAHDVCVTCGEGFIPNEDQTECVACPANEVSELGWPICVPCKSGYESFIADYGFSSGKNVCMLPPPPKEPKKPLTDQQAEELQQAIDKIQRQVQLRASNNKCQLNEYGFTEYEEVEAHFPENRCKNQAGDQFQALTIFLYSGWQDTWKGGSVVFYSKDPDTGIITQYEHCGPPRRGSMIQYHWCNALFAVYKRETQETHEPQIVMYYTIQNQPSSQTYLQSLDEGEIFLDVTTGKGFPECDYYAPAGPTVDNPGASASYSSIANNYACKCVDTTCMVNPLEFGLPGGTYRYDRLCIRDHKRCLTSTLTMCRPFDETNSWTRPCYCGNEKEYNICDESIGQYCVGETQEGEGPGTCAFCNGNDVMILSESGESSCAPCGAGFTSNTDHSACILCPDGTVKSESATVCTQCPIGTVPNTEHTACAPCGAGFTSNTDHSACVPVDCVVSDGSAINNMACHCGSAFCGAGDYCNAAESICSEKIYPAKVYKVIGHNDGEQGQTCETMGYDYVTDENECKSYFYDVLYPEKGQAGYSQIQKSAQLSLRSYCSVHMGGTSGDLVFGTAGESHTGTCTWSFRCVCTTVDTQCPEGVQDAACFQPCSHTDSFTENTENCRCGSTICTGQTGRFCDGQSCADTSKICQQAGNIYYDTPYECHKGSYACVTGYTYDDAASMCKPVPYVEDDSQTDEQKAVAKIAHFSSLRKGNSQKRSEETWSDFNVRKFKEMKVNTQNYFMEQMAAKHKENNALPIAAQKTAHEMRKELRMPLSIADDAYDFKATLKTKLQTLFGADRDVGIIVGPVNDESSERCADYVPAATFDDDDDCITYDAAIENDKTDVHVLGSDDSYNVGGVLLGSVYVPVVKQSMENVIAETFRMQCWDAALKQWDSGQVLSSGEEIVCAVRGGDVGKSVKTIVGSSVSGSVEETLLVTYSMSLENTYELCEGDTTKYIEVLKNGYFHNVYEVGAAAVYEALSREDVPDTERKLSAPQGTAREFYCSYHPKNRFTVYCRKGDGSCPDGYEETSDGKCAMSDARLLQNLQCKGDHLLSYYASNAGRLCS